MDLKKKRKRIVRVEESVDALGKFLHMACQLWLSKKEKQKQIKKKKKLTRNLSIK